MKSKEYKGEAEATHPMKESIGSGALAPPKDVTIKKRIYFA